MVYSLKCFTVKVFKINFWEVKKSSVMAKQVRFRPQKDPANLVLAGFPVFRSIVNNYIMIFKRISDRGKK